MTGIGIDLEKKIQVYWKMFYAWDCVECINPLDGDWTISHWVFEKHQFLISPGMFFKVKIMPCEKFSKFDDVQRARKRHFETCKLKGKTMISQCI